MPQEIRGLRTLPFKCTCASSCVCPNVCSYILEAVVKGALWLLLTWVVKPWLPFSSPFNIQYIIESKSFYRVYQILICVEYPFVMSEETKLSGLVRWCGPDVMIHVIYSWPPCVVWWRPRPRVGMEDERSNMVNTVHSVIVYSFNSLPWIFPFNG